MPTFIEEDEDDYPGEGFDPIEAGIELKKILA